jgi:hypothetical protein
MPPIQLATIRRSCLCMTASSMLLTALIGCGGSSGSGTVTTGSGGISPATLSWPGPAAIVYGAALGAAQLDATANTAGTFTYSPAAGTVLTAGTQTLSVTFTPANTAAYSAATSSVQLTVSKATPVVTWAAPTAISYTVPLSNAQLNAIATTPGTFVYSPAIGTKLSAGTQTLTVTFTPTDATDYASPITQNTSLTVATPSYTWKNVQIVGSGFITGIVAHPTQTNLRYVRTDIGGAYRWNATTNSWTPLLDFVTNAQDNYLGVESIALDPTNPQKVYMAVGTYAAESFASNGAFLLSSNQGATFTVVPASIKMGSNDSGRFAGERLAVDPNLPSTLYFGSRLSGLWRSTNSGTSWAQVASFSITGLTNGVGVVFVDFVTASGSTGSATPVIYVGVSDSGATPTNYSNLYRSVDGGSTWAAVPGAPTGLYVNHGVLGPDNTNANTALYLSYGNAPGPTGVTGGSLWKYTLPASTSPTGAGTWTNISVGAPARPGGSQGGYGAITLDPERPGVVMASTMDDYYPGDDIYRSTNYGASWVSLNAQGKTHNYAGNCAYQTSTPVVPCSAWLDFHNPGATIGTGNWPGSLLIDPFNSSHFLYGTGQTLWDTANLQVSDTGSGPSFSVGALGIEEASIGPLLSPTAGASLVSGMGDIDGFVHTDLTVSPAIGMIGPSNTKTIGKTESLDFAQNVPLTVVLDGTGSGAYSAIATDGGVTTSSWTAMSTPTGSASGQGTIAIAADASTIVWDTSDGPVAYSTNNGTTWTNATGAILHSHVYSDRVNPKKFYIVSGNTLQISTDGGMTFANVTTTLPNGANMAVSSAAEGDLWIAAGSTFLHSTNSGTSFTTVTGLTTVSVVGFGKAAAGASYPAIYTIASGNAGTGFYRSIDAGATWTYLNDAAHQFAYCETIIGDPRIFGRLYIGTNGRGIVYGDSPF